jgi:hypothetical protein
MFKRIVSLVLKLAACLAGGVVFASGCEIAQGVFDIGTSVWDLVDLWV